MRQILTVKLKKHLQEFLRCKLADEAREASSRNLIGSVLGPLLEYAPRDYVFERPMGPEYISFELPDGLGGKDTAKGTVYLSEQNQRAFERILNVYFRDLFYQYVDDKVRYRREIKKCIMQFCMDYRISFDHITYEMLKKAYYRRAQKQKIFSVKMSLACPLIFLL